MQTKFEVKAGVHKVSKREWQAQTEAFDNGVSMGAHVYETPIFKRKAEAALFAKALAQEEERRVLRKVTAALQVMEALLKRV